MFRVFHKYWNCLKYSINTGMHFLLRATTDLEQIVSSFRPWRPFRPCEFCLSIDRKSFGRSCSEEELSFSKSLPVVGIMPPGGRPGLHHLLQREGRIRGKEVQTNSSRQESIDQVISSDRIWIQLVFLWNLRIAWPPVPASWLRGWIDCGCNLRAEFDRNRWM